MVSSKFPLAIWIANLLGETKHLIMDSQWLYDLSYSSRPHADLLSPYTECAQWKTPCYGEVNLIQDGIGLDAVPTWPHDLKMLHCDYIPIPVPPSPSPAFSPSPSHSHLLLRWSKASPGESPKSGVPSWVRTKALPTESGWERLPAICNWFQKASLCTKNRFCSYCQPLPPTDQATTIIHIQIAYFSAMQDPQQSVHSLWAPASSAQLSL